LRTSNSSRKIGALKKESSGGVILLYLQAEPNADEWIQHVCWRRSWYKSRLWW